MIQVNHTDAISHSYKLQFKSVVNYYMPQLQKPSTSAFQINIRHMKNSSIGKVTSQHKESK